MTDPIYYLPSGLTLTGNEDAPISGEAGVKAALLQYLGSFLQGSNVGIKTLYFAVSTLGGVATTFEVNLEFDGNGGVRFSDNQDQFYDIAESATLNLILFGVTTLVPAIAGAPLLLVAAGVGVATVLYNTFLSDSVYEIYEMIKGTVNTDIQLQDADGNVLAGALYKDGLTSLETSAAVEELLTSPVSHSDYPVADVGDVIQIYKGSSDTAWEIYKFYDPEIVQNAVNIFFAGNADSFESLTATNDYLYNEMTIDGEVVQQLYARTKIDGTEVTDYTQTADQLLLSTRFFSDGEDTSLSEHPELIAFHDSEGNFYAGISNISTNYEWLVYLGNNFDNSVLYENAQDNQMFGAGGSDTLKGGAGDDYIYGDYVNLLSETTGADSGNDILYGGTGSDRVYGGGGDDTLYAAADTYGLEGDVYFGGAEFLLPANDGTDTLNYSEVRFSIGVVLGCQDSENMVSEQTLIYQANSQGGAYGKDDKASSIERFILTNNKDWVTYSSNVDYTIETLDGGEGKNVISFSDITNIITIDLVEHNVSIPGGFDINELINFTGFETGSGGDIFIDGEYAQSYNGNDGIDTIDFSQSSRHVVIDQSGGESLSLNLNSNTYDSDTFTNIERFIGTNGNDYFYVKEGEQSTYFNGAGNTNSTVNGEVYTGYDVVSFEYHSSSNDDTGVSVNLSSGRASDNAGTAITFDNVEGVIGSQGIDTFEGTSNADWIFGEGGNDTINGGGGNDHIIGGEGADIINGGDGNDTYYITHHGIHSFDTINDTAGIDVLYFTENYNFDTVSFVRDEDNNIFKTSNSYEMYFEINGLDTIEKVTYVDGACFAVEGLGLSFSQDYADPYVDPIIDHEIGFTIYGDKNDQPTEDNLVGTEKSETIYGLELDDILSGADGDDTLHGGSGDDTLNGGEHKDRLFGDADNDTLNGGNGSDSLNGGAGNDTLRGGDGNDALGGNGGNDYLYGDNGNDGISGGEGNDHLYGNAGSDHLYGNEGDDYLYGQEDDDHLEGGVGDDELNGDIGNDLLEGEDGADTIYGGVGDDALYAGGGNATISDATSVDILFGESGNDFLYGSGGGDILSGGEGHDYLQGEDGDELHGDEGEDQLYGYSNTTLDGGDGNDFLEGSGSNVTYVVSAGTDVIFDTGDSSVLLYEEGTIGDLTFERAANDSLVITKTGGDRVVVLNHFSGKALEYISFGGALVELSTLDNNISFYTSVNAYDNPVYAAAIEQSFMGGDGNNIYESRGVDDTVDMGTGQNTVVLNNVSDASTVLLSTEVDGEQDIIKIPAAISFDEIDFVYDSGDMNLYFGNNKITIDGATLNGQSTHILVEIGQGVVQQKTLADMDLTIVNSDGDLNGYSVDDTLYADSDGSGIGGRTGNDTLYGGAGNDGLDGGEGDDTIYDGDGDDSVYGGPGADTLIGGGGNDTYYIDVSDYYAGVNDVLTMGAGNNTVVLDWDYQNDENGDIRTLSSLIVEIEGVDSFDDLRLIKTYEEDGNGEPITINPIYTLHYTGNTLVIEEYEELFGLPTIRLSDTGEEKNLQEFTLITDMSSYSTHGSAEDAPQLAQNDLYYGTSGDDFLMFSLGKDVVYAGDGNDSIQKNYAIYNDETGNLVMESPSVEDTFEIYGEGGDDTLFGSPGSDYLDGGDGNDIISSGFVLSGDIGSNMIKGGAGDDELFLCSLDSNEVDGGEGSDTISAYYLSSLGLITEGVVVDLNEGTITSDSLTSNLSNIENIDGSELDDHIIGDGGNNILNGYGGTDILEGGDGDDTYEFYDGTNIIKEIGGHDVIDFVYANYADVAPYLSIDIIGFDMEITVDDISYTIEQQFIGQDYRQVEELKFMDTSLSLINYTSWYTDANQGLPITVVGSDTAEPLIGTEGLIDTVDYSGSTEGVTVDLAGTGLGGTAEGDAYFSIENVVGTVYDDILTGNDDVNELIAGIGNDILNGGAGDDILSGGDGDDTYVFDIGGGLNTIVETSGLDVIKLGLGLVFDDLTFIQDGNDLIIQIASGFIVTDFYSGNPDLIVEQISFGDGTTFDLTSLLNDNSAPVAVDDAFLGDEDSVITGNVRDNDTDIDGDALSITPETLITANGGTVELLAEGAFTYTPAANFNGTDGFEYILEDEAGATDTGNVTLTVNAVDDAPVLTNNGAGVDEDNSITLTQAMLSLADVDTDPENRSFTLQSQLTNGTLYLNGVALAVAMSFTEQDIIDQLVTFEPNANFNGSDSFDFIGSDGTIDLGVQTFTINVAAVNDAPDAAIDEFSGSENTVISGNVLDNDTDIDGDALSVTPVTLTTANGGIMELLADGGFTYTAAADFSGKDSFEYILEDGAGETDTGAVTLIVNPVDDAPILTNNGAAVDEDNTITLTQAMLSLADVDTDAANRSFTLQNQPTNGTLYLNGVALSVAMSFTEQDIIDQLVTFEPNANFNGSDSFDFIGSDGTTNLDVLTFAINVAAVNDAPDAANDEFSGDEDIVVTGNLFADNGNGTDSDVDGDSLSIVAVNDQISSVGNQITLASGALLSVAANGQIEYNPNGQFNQLESGQTATDSFQYTISDANGGTDTASATINIYGESEAVIVQIGDAPDRLPRSDRNAWVNAWSDDEVQITHRADYQDDSEVWTEALFTGNGGTTLSGGDIRSGDLGVSGVTQDGNDAYLQEVDGTEALKFEFDTTAVKAMFDMTRFYSNDDGNGNSESLRIQALDEDKNVVGEVVRTAESTNGNSSLTFELENGFSELIITSGAYNDGDFIYGALSDAEGNAILPTGEGMGSEFMIEAVEFELGQQNDSDSISLLGVNDNITENYVDVY